MPRKTRKQQIRSAAPGESTVPAPVLVNRGPTFDPDYSPVIKDLKRIGLLAGFFITVLVALAFLLPQLMP